MTDCAVGTKKQFVGARRQNPTIKRVVSHAEVSVINWREVEHMYLLNAFSANMLAGFPASVSFAEISVDAANELLSGGFTSAVGHADTAAVFSSVLGTEVPMNRATLSLKSGDAAVVGQYIGPRMPEGTTTLPEGATIKWLHLRVA